MNKTFNTLSELWKYCLFCPLCQEPCRTIDISVGPDESWQLTEFRLENNKLELFCFWIYDPEAKRNKDYSAIFTINCADNTYQVKVAGEVPELLKLEEEDYFYIYLHSKCNFCHQTYLDSSDIDFDQKCKTISNIGLDREGARLVSTKDKYHITLSYNKNIMEVSRLYEALIGSPIEDERIINLPLIDLDFTNPTKVCNKIKTLILFS